MAKKRRRHRQPPGRSRRQPIESQDLPDRRIMEGTMRDMVRQLGGEVADTPLSQAQDIMSQAFAARDEGERIRLAEQALTICPDCADAYVLLAEHAPRRKRARELYEQGVAAGERALGPEAFERDVGHFWGMLETRPYMRARLGLAFALWAASRREEAVQHLQDMLRLNPTDNQGIRYSLAAFLLFLDRDDDLAHLLQQYADEGSASWAYTRALLAFRQHGDTPEARQLLKQAKKTNRYVPAYLMGRKHPPAREPGYYSIGDESEALNYVGSFLVGWKSTPGAVAWLRANDAKAKKKQAEARQARGPLGFIKKWLKERLPQTYDVWQADFRQLPNWVRIAGENVRPWTAMVTSRSNDLILAHELPEGEPSAAFLWDALVKAMQYPGVGEAHRPTELQIRPGGYWDELKPHIEDIGIQLETVEELDHLDFAFREMSDQICGKPEPGLLDMPGITPEQVGHFYDAAAYFFQQAPWKKVGYESAIEVEKEHSPSGPWYAVLMGQSGLSMGLAVYEELETLRQLWAGELADKENARRTVATTVTFGEESDIPVPDLEAAKRYGWKVARSDAFPSVYHKERGLSSRPPLAWELELMGACLRAIPQFVNRRPQDDTTREEITVPVTSGEMRLSLAWVPEEDASGP
jgi:hypothetical protein